MNPRAQAGLEYLMTYGWALILVATIITVLVFVVGGEKPGVTFASSDPTKILLKSAGVSGDTAGIVLGNATGGNIRVNSVSFFGDLGSSASFSLNGMPSFPIDVIAGGEMRLENIAVTNNCAQGGAIEVTYTDYANFERQVRVSCGAGSTEMAGLVASFSLDGSVADGSKKQHSSTPYGTIVYEPAGCPSGSCLKFDGTTYIQVPDSDDLDVSLNGVTIMLWVKTGPATLNTNQLVLNKGQPQNGGQGSYRLSFAASTNNLYSYFQPATGTYTTMASKNVSRGDGLWHHVAASAVSVPGSGKTTIKMYKDGAVTLTPINTRELGLSNQTQDLYIGMSGAGYGSFIGVIDEVKIFNKVLSDTEVCSECKRFAGNVGVTCVCG